MKSKRNIIILTIAVFVLSITTVYAITIIRASDVTYDTSKSNGSSNNVQGAIDELYDKVSNYKEPLINENMISYITDLAKSDTTNLVYDDTADKNLRYIGSNPNNYVEFNGELWRIIGVMNNVKDEKGNSASRVKMIREESIGTISWDITNLNNWNTSSLRKILNSGDYFNRTNNYSNVGLSKLSKSMISSVVWNLGGHNTASVTTANLYNYERGTNTYSDNATTCTGYVGLMYPSDYGYAVGGSVRTSCLKKDVIKYSTDDCYNNDYLYKSTFWQWTLNSYINNSKHLFAVNPSGLVDVGAGAANEFGVRPVVYLDTNLLITKGKGTLTNPYKISFEKEIEESTPKDETKNLITKITNLAVSDTTNLVTDDTVDKNIRYIGKNPNNYIKFNDELWRIIGIMNNVKDSNGITSSRVKIIRDESTKSLAWDEKNLNNWEESTLEKLLNNGDYFNQKGKYATNGLNTDSKT